MSIEQIGFTVGGISLLLTFFGFFTGIRSELRKHTDSLIATRVEEEKRHSCHEKRLGIIEDRMTFTEVSIKNRLDKLDRKLDELSSNFFIHLKDSNYE